MALGLLAAVATQWPGSDRGAPGFSRHTAAGILALGRTDTMRNPGAVYCSDLGYEHETVTGPDGGQTGLCRFEDGTACDDWAFLSGRCRRRTGDHHR